MFQTLGKKERGDGASSEPPAGFFIYIWKIFADLWTPAAQVLHCFWGMREESFDFCPSGSSWDQGDETDW